MAPDAGGGRHRGRGRCGPRDLPGPPGPHRAAVPVRGVGALLRRRLGCAPRRRDPRHAPRAPPRSGYARAPRRGARRRQRPRLGRAHGARDPADPVAHHPAHEDGRGRRTPVPAGAAGPARLAGGGGRRRAPRRTARHGPGGARLPRRRPLVAAADAGCGAVAGTPVVCRVVRARGDGLAGRVAGLAGRPARDRPGLGGRGRGCSPGRRPPGGGLCGPGPPRRADLPAARRARGRPRGRAGRGGGAGARQRRPRRHRQPRPGPSPAALPQPRARPRLTARPGGLRVLPHPAAARPEAEADGWRTRRPLTGPARPGAERPGALPAHRPRGSRAVGHRARGGGGRRPRSRGARPCGSGIGRRGGLRQDDHREGRGAGHALPPCLRRRARRQPARHRGGQP